MPGDKNGGTPDDYAEWKRQQAQEVPVRDVEDSSETTEERTQRHLQYSVPADESPDARTQRYLEKARRAGYTSSSPQAPVRNGPPREPQVDLELDGNNQPVHPGLTWQNAGTELPQRMADAVSPSLPKLDPANTELAIMRLKNSIDQKAIPAAHAARQGVPGMDALSRALTATQRAREAPPAVRQPVMQERGFSNDDEKQRYLDKVRQAMASAGKK